MNLRRKACPLATHSCCLQDEIWNGSSMSLEAAVDLFGADEAYPLSEVKAFEGDVPACTSSLSS